MKPKELKIIPLSKRANIYYLEMCRVMQKDERVVYFVEDIKGSRYYNIPYANTVCILLGTGTSITQATVRLLSQAGVAVGFCGGGGTPLFAGTDIVWLTSQSEYRPTQYLQGWVAFWYDEKKRIEAAKYFQKRRLEYTVKLMEKDRKYKQYSFSKDFIDICDVWKNKVSSVKTIQELLSVEGELVKKLYATIAKNFEIENFVRDKHGTDDVNAFLSHGNYLAYGIAATTLWGLGIPHGFPVMHGKTRRGALVFDVADLVKDSTILPTAFLSYVEGVGDNEMRKNVLEKFLEHEAMDYMFETIENTIELFG